MFVSSDSIELMKGAAEALGQARQINSIDEVRATVPVYEVGGLLHPQVSKSSGFAAQVSFQEFGLVVAAPDEKTLTLRLLPPEDKKVSTPILKPEQEDFYEGLPTVGFAALRAIVITRGKARGRFFLFGEDDTGKIKDALTMPSQGSATKLVEVVSSAVRDKAPAALRAQRERQAG